MKISSGLSFLVAMRIMKTNKRRKGKLGRKRGCTLTAYLAGYSTAFLNARWNPASAEVQLAHAYRSVAAALLSFPLSLTRSTALPC